MVLSGAGVGSKLISLWLYGYSVASARNPEAGPSVSA